MNNQGAHAQPNLSSACGQSTGGLSTDGQTNSSHMTLPETRALYRLSPIRE